MKWNRKGLIMKYTELSETVELMQSADYKDRFKAEYYQLEIRIIKLEDFIRRAVSGEEKHTCRIGMLQEQLRFMRAYRGILISRAHMEHITL